MAITIHVPRALTRHLASRRSKRRALAALPGSRHTIGGVLPSSPLQLNPRPARCRMLRRKSTRIALKPEDRDEYFAHKQATKPAEPVDPKDKSSDKEVRIGLKTTR